MRPSGRQAHQLRPIQFTRNYTKHAEGSVLVEFGDTKVLCTATHTEGAPRFLKGSGQGWVTAEYGMLPRSTHSRNDREAAKGKQGGRTLEIQRLIGRSLRSAVDLNSLGENTLVIDCDVIQADGGTRTAAITGGCLALADALALLHKQSKIAKNPFKSFIGSVSVGIYQGVPVVDLDYIEDSNADIDMNFVMDEAGGFVEIQGTAEKKTFQPEELQAMLGLATPAIAQLIAMQRQAFL